MTEEQDTRAQETHDTVIRGASRVNVQTVGTWIAVIASFLGLTTSWVVLPYRMAAAERSIAALQARSDFDHETIVRIDEKTRSIDSRTEDIRRLLESRKP